MKGGGGGRGGVAGMVMPVLWLVLCSSGANAQGSGRTKRVQIEGGWVGAASEIKIALPPPTTPPNPTPSLLSPRRPDRIAPHRTAPAGFCHSCLQPMEARLPWRPNDGAATE